MSMRRLVAEYRRSIRWAKQVYDAADSEVDKPVIGGMIGDMEYAVDWMEHGRCPDSHKGAERTRVYYFEPSVLENIAENMGSPEWHRKPADVAKIDNFLGSCLTKREEEVYRLYIGEQLSMGKISELLHIAKTSVQNLIERAEKKVDAEKEQVRLFLF